MTKRDEAYPCSRRGAVQHKPGVFLTSLSKRGDRVQPGSSSYAFGNAACPVRRRGRD